MSHAGAAWVGTLEKRKMMVLLDTSTMDKTARNAAERAAKYMSGEIKSNCLKLIDKSESLSSGSKLLAKSKIDTALEIIPKYFGDLFTVEVLSEHAHKLCEATVALLAASLDTETSDDETDVDTTTAQGMEEIYRNLMHTFEFMLSFKESSETKIKEEVESVVGIILNKYQDITISEPVQNAAADIVYIKIRARSRLSILEQMKDTKSGQRPQHWHVLA